MPSIPRASGARARIYRKLAKRSQEALAAEAGLDVSTVRRFEAGDPVSNNSVENIAAALNVPPANLYVESELVQFLQSRLPDLDDPTGASVAPTRTETVPCIDPETFERFELLPKELKGNRFRVSFENPSWARLDPSVAENMQGAALDAGACLRSFATEIFDDRSERIGSSDLFASGDIAVGLLEKKKGAKVVAVAKTVFAVTVDRYTSYHPHEPKVYEEDFGLLIEELDADTGAAPSGQ